MMRVSIKGTVSIPVEVWSNSAHMHQEFADSLCLALGYEDRFLVDVLLHMIDRHETLAEICDVLRKETKKGRPKKKVPNLQPTSYRLSDMLLIGRVVSKKKIGRPVTFGAAHDRLTFKRVEQRRGELASENRSKSTIKAAIDSLNMEKAKAQPVQESIYVGDNYTKVHNSYLRGRKQI